MLKSGFIWANINIQGFQSIAGHIVARFPVYCANQEQLHGLNNHGLISRRGAFVFLGGLVTRPISVLMFAIVSTDYIKKIPPLFRVT